MKSVNHKIEVLDGELYDYKVDNDKYKAENEKLVKNVQTLEEDIKAKYAKFDNQKQEIIKQKEEIKSRKAKLKNFSTHLKIQTERSMAGQMKLNNIVGATIWGIPEDEEEDGHYD